MNCYNCDTLLESTWNYCPNCKRKLKKKKINEEEYVACDEIGKCHTCSCELNDKWNFCPICGTSVDFYSEKPNIVLPTIATNVEVETKIIDENIVKLEDDKKNLNEETVGDASEKNQNKKRNLFPNTFIVSIVSYLIVFLSCLPKVVAFFFNSEIGIVTLLLSWAFFGIILPSAMLLYAVCTFVIGLFLVIFKKSKNYRLIINSLFVGFILIALRALAYALFHYFYL